MSLDGKYLIPFYPDDLKALSTLLWANSLIQDHTVSQGLRCKTKHPDYDMITGHVNDSSCSGVDPGDFHVSVLEMIGARKTPFIINRSNNTQVWNQPIAAYNLEYYSPATGETGNLSDVMMPKNSFQDPYSDYRNKATVSIVGVHMVLKYTSENIPDHTETDSTSDDTIKKLELYYDLELDANKQIVGGEWRGSNDMVHLYPAYRATHQNQSNERSIPTYPGFIWKFDTKDPVAYSIADPSLPQTDLTKIDHASLIAASRQAAHFTYHHYKYDDNGNSVRDASGNLVIERDEVKPQPLQKVVKFLVDQSKASK
jgi:hypothetical protein